MRQTLLSLIELKEGSKNEGKALGIHVEEDLRPILLPVRSSIARPFESGELPIVCSIKSTFFDRQDLSREFFANAWITCGPAPLMGAVSIR
jgi:hypothetical protein